LFLKIREIRNKHEKKRRRPKNSKEQKKKRRPNKSKE